MIRRRHGCIVEMIALPFIAFVYAVMAIAFLFWLTFAAIIVGAVYVATQTTWLVRRLRELHSR